MPMDLSSDSDIDVTHEIHIHSFTVEFEGPNKMTQQWTSYSLGKKAQVVKVALLEANQTNNAPDETRH